MPAKEQEFEPVDKGILAVPFEALFDGDEVNGKRYALGDIITGLDAPTAHFLTSQGRIREVSGEKAEAMEKVAAAEKRERKKQPTAEQQAAIDAENLRKEIAAKIEAGEIPSDLQAEGKPLENDRLEEIAKAEGIDLEKTTKDEMLLEIMLARSAKA